MDEDNGECRLFLDTPAETEEVGDLFDNISVCFEASMIGRDTASVFGETDTFFFVEKDKLVRVWIYKDRITVRFPYKADKLIVSFVLVDTKLGRGGRLFKPCVKIVLYIVL